MQWELYNKLSNMNPLQIQEHLLPVNKTQQYIQHISVQDNYK